MKKLFTIIALSAIILLGIYCILRIHATNDANRDSDAFFAGFSSAHNECIKNHLNLVGQNMDDALAIMGKLKDAITNFDYKNSKPHINLMLNKARVDVSWRLTVFFVKIHNSWFISKFNEYSEN
jgi:DNA polymerase II large subunit